MVVSSIGYGKSLYSYLSWSHLFTPAIFLSMLYDDNLVLNAIVSYLRGMKINKKNEVLYYCMLKMQKKPNTFIWPRFVNPLNLTLKEKQTTRKIYRSLVCYEVYILLRYIAVYMFYMFEFALVYWIITPRDLPPRDYREACLNWLNLSVRCD